MDFDELLLQHVGEFGRGQLVVLLAASAGWATLAVAVLSMVFVTQTPSWSCTSATDEFCQHQQQLQQHDPTALCKLSPAQFSWDNPESSLLSTFGLVCEYSWMTGWANSVFFIGYAIGSALFGWVADTHGRKTALIASSVSTALATLLCSASNSYAWYIAGRILQGLCCSGLPIAAFVLATESVGPTCRGRAGTGSQLVYHLGEWVLPLCAFILQDWRQLYVAVAACCVLTAMLAVFVPESPRWQLLHGRRAPAVLTLKWMAHLNGRQLPAEVAEQLMQGGLQKQGSAQLAEEDALCLLTEAAAAATAADGEECTQGAATDLSMQDSEGAALLCRIQRLPPASKALQADGGAQQVPQAYQQDHKQQRLDLQYQQQQIGSCVTGPRHKNDSVWMIFTDPLLATLFWVSAWMCTVMAAGFFTANLATEKLQGSLYWNFIITSAGEVPATIIGAVAVDAIGRRPTIATGLLVTGIACCVCSLLNPGGWSTALASLGKSSCSSTWTLTYIYASELMPTSMRSTALASSNQAARLGGAVAPFFVYAGERLGHPKLPFALVGTLATLTAVLTGLLPETRGKGQPDTMEALRSMYGNISSSSSASGGNDSNSGCSADDVAAGGQKYAEWSDNKGLLQAQGSGLVQRLLSSASSGGSWLVGAVRAGSFASGSGQQPQEHVLRREGSELLAIVSDSAKPATSLG